uniref:TRDC protein n=1 Tax=Gongylonema pulchrum TaxID=637853 RepID=A0A183EJE4_9BILA
LPPESVTNFDVTGDRLDSPIQQTSGISVQQPLKTTVTASETSLIGHGVTLVSSQSIGQNKPTEIIPHGLVHSTVLNDATSTDTVITTSSAPVPTKTVRALTTAPAASVGLVKMQLVSSIVYKHFGESKELIRHLVPSS